MKRKLTRKAPVSYQVLAIFDDIRALKLEMRLLAESIFGMRGQISVINDKFERMHAQSVAMHLENERLRNANATPPTPAQ